MEEKKNINDAELVNSLEETVKEYESGEGMSLHDQATMEEFILTFMRENNLQKAVFEFGDEVIEVEMVDPETDEGELQ